VPVSGLPDPDQHWACTRCGQWFEAEEGKLYEPGRASIAGTLADSIRGGANLKFRCDSCTAKRRQRRALFYFVLGLLVISGPVLRTFGVF
jgi:hypothetical protein